MAFEEGEGSFCFVALTYILEPSTLGEQKSKAAQLGVKRLMELGIQPQILACRAQRQVTETVLQKMAMFSNVPQRRVFSMHDRESIYTIPESMRAEGLDREVLTVIDLHNRVNQATEDGARRQWGTYANRILSDRKYAVTIGILGKYTALRDAYASIDKAIEHAATHLDTSVDLKWLDVSDVTAGNAEAFMCRADVDGVIVPGGFGERGVEGKIACIHQVRTNGIPFLGICLGFQMAVIEYARSVLGVPDAHSTEFLQGHPNAVIAELPEQKKIEGLGGSMRLGGQDVLITPGTVAEWLYENTTVRERFRHRYEVEPEMIEALEGAGLRFSGRHGDHPIMQILELDPSLHPYFVGTQFHPELTSRPLSPQPLFMGLVAASIAQANPDTPRDAISTRWLHAGNGAQALA
jgi:CTP synthase